MTVNGQKCVMMITKFAHQNVVKMMIVRVRFVMKPKEFVCLNVKLMLIVNGTMRNVTKRIMFADQFALNMKIVTAYHVIPIKGFVIQA